MLKSNLKPSEKKRAVPDWLGVFSVLPHVSEIVENGRAGCSWDLEFDFSEELETFQLDRSELKNVGEREREIEDERFEGVSGVRTSQNQTSVHEISAPAICSIVEDRKRADLEFQLSQKVINLETLQSIASSGIPHGDGLRATAWKLLLGYLPTDHDLWEGELADNRSKYASLKEELILNPSEMTRRKDEVLSLRKDKESDIDGMLRRHEISHGDHPLSLGKASVWHQYFQDAEIAEQIDRDLQRTHPDLGFFSGDSPFSKKNREAMRNILLLFAKLNPVIRYVQGMNEVLALLYYVFRTDPDERNSSNAEADSFACFVRLLSDSVDHFCQQLDNSSVGIHSTLSRLSELLKVHDKELWRHLEITTKVNPQFYAFRWITLLLTQEFNFHAIMRIWDSLLSNPLGVQEMLLRVCCAMLICVRSKLLKGDFTANLKLLQRYPQIDIDYLLQVANEISTESLTY